MPTDLQFQPSNNDSDMPRKATKKEGKGFGFDKWVGFVDSKRVGGGGEQTYVEWDIPTDITDSCLDKERAQMEYRNQSSQAMKSCLYPLKTTNQPTPQTSPIIPHPFKVKYFPPCKTPPQKTPPPHESNLPNQKLPKKK